MCTVVWLQEKSRQSLANASRDLAVGLWPGRPSRAGVVDPVPDLPELPKLPEVSFTELPGVACSRGLLWGGFRSCARTGGSWTSNL